MRQRLTLVLGLLAGLSTTAARGQADAAGRYALLVGCTRYPSLPESYQLKGPANDVALMRQLLTNRFGFDEAKIVTLAESAGSPGLKPTRTNIERAFRRLAEQAKRGDQVVILMAGHGSQEPDADPPSADDPEPDGLDEIFLPADVGAWDGRTGRVTNAIVDDELRTWLAAITTRGASVCIIMDACHSGTMTRGADEDVPRQVPPTQLVPAATLEAVQKRVLASQERSRGGPADDVPVDHSSASSGLVAIYAAQSTEPTVERPLPANSPAARPYGLLTYTLCEILMQSASALTYTELIERVHEQYVQWGRSFPTPLLEGPDRDREVLGARHWPDRARILVAPGSEGGWTINAGALLGLTAGSVLEVLPPAGQKEADKPLGYVRIKSTGALDAEVEPISHGGMPAPAQLPRGARCRVAFHDYGAHRLRIALAEPNASVPLKTALQDLGKGDDALLQWVENPRQADWLIRIESDHAFLVPAAGYSSARPPPLFGPVPADVESLIPWLTDRLARVARAQALLAMSSPEGESAASLDSSVEIGVDLVRYRSRNEQDGEVVAWQSAGRTLRAGDYVAFRVENRGKTAIDVTFLFVDSGYGITAWYPKPGQAGDNRVAAGKMLLAPRAKVNARTVGLEHMVVIAVEAAPNQLPVDFSSLAQPTIETARTRGAGGALDSPLGRLLQSALYAQGGTRGLESTEVSTHAVRAISWQVSDSPAPAK